MRIYYPTYYVVPVVPVMFLDEDEYNLRNEEYNDVNNMQQKEGYNTYINVNKEIFEEIDDEYVNENTK
jgi:hypothetical protein